MPSLVHSALIFHPVQLRRQAWPSFLLCFLKACFSSFHFYAGIGMWCVWCRAGSRFSSLPPNRQLTHNSTKPTNKSSTLLFSCIFPAFPHHSINTNKNGSYFCCPCAHTCSVQSIFSFLFKLFCLLLLINRLYHGCSWAYATEF